MEKTDLDIIHENAVDFLDKVTQLREAQKAYMEVRLSTNQSLKDIVGGEVERKARAVDHAITSISRILDEIKT